MYIKCYNTCLNASLRNDLLNLIKISSQAKVNYLTLAIPISLLNEMR